MAKIRLGKPQTSMSRPAHTPGVKQGNSVGNYEKQSGHLPDGRGTAERSTGINAADRNPIDPRMPNLSPA
jgi:hypothetical protein